MLTPDYVICIECETPAYVFEWKNDLIHEALCEVCGNDDPAQFVTEDEYEDMAMDGRYAEPPKS